MFASSYLPLSLINRDSQVPGYGVIDSLAQTSQEFDDFARIEPEEVVIVDQSTERALNLPTETSLSPGAPCTPPPPQVNSLEVSKVSLSLSEGNGEVLANKVTCCTKIHVTEVSREMCDLGTTLQSAALLAMLCALSFTEPLPGSNVAVRYKHSLTAVTGQNVTLQCEFMLQFEVLQLTWQKIKGFTSENVATYSKKYGVKVLGAFSKRVHIEGIRTSMTSFSLQAVKLEDEACYICIFNAYPHGFYSGKTCLHVQ
ncbi:uncharacterized protein LOC115082421, partial [Rhinatrema bivittatum]|uniref:uncharacterized protein LOC115082421 n=1 Tax=Rhinatrema bivittatum TaxID=194408 RepID=UPI0011268252